MDLKISPPHPIKQRSIDILNEPDIRLDQIFGLFISSVRPDDWSSFIRYPAGYLSRDPDSGRITNSVPGYCISGKFGFLPISLIRMKVWAGKVLFSILRLSMWNFTFWNRNNEKFFLLIISRITKRLKMHYILPYKSLKGIFYLTMVLWYTVLYIILFPMTETVWASINLYDLYIIFSFIFFSS